MAIVHWLGKKPFAFTRKTDELAVESNSSVAEDDEWGERWGERALSCPCTIEGAKWMILEGGNVTSLQWETEAVLQNHSEPTFLVPVLES